MGTFKKIIGDRIRKRRKEVGYASQELLAAAVGTDKSRVSRWESGRQQPKGDYLLTLLRLLKMSESELFGVADRVPPAKTIAEMTPAALIAEIKGSAGSDQTEVESSLLRAFRDANDDRKKAILNQAGVRATIDDAKARASRKGSN